MSFDFENTATKVEKQLVRRHSRTELEQKHIIQDFLINDIDIDHKTSAFSFMHTNNTHSNYNPFRISSIAEVTANPDLYMSSDFTIEMWLLRDFAEASDPSTDTYNGDYDVIIGSSDSSGFTLSISNFSRRANVQSPAYTNTQGWRVINHGDVRIMNGTTHINTWSYQATLGQQPTYGNYIDGNHPGGGIPEKEWFHLAIVRKDSRLGCFIDGHRHTHNNSVEDTEPGQNFTGAIEFSQPWYMSYSHTSCPCLHTDNSHLNITHH